MRPLPLLRGEKLSTSSHSLFFRLIPSDPIEKHRLPLCRTKGRKADRASAIFRFWLSVVIQPARSVPLPPPRYWSSKRMNEPNLRDYGDFLATVNGARRCRVRARKKRAAGWFSRFVGSREWWHKCAIVGPGSRLREHERSRCIVVRLLSTINYVLP